MRSPPTANSSNCPASCLTSISPSAGSGRRRWRTPPSRSKKTVRAVQDEIACEVARFLKVIVSARRKTGAFDLEALEEATRAAMQRAGAALLQTLLGEDQEHEPDTPRPCSCGQPAHCEGPRPKQLVTLLGRVVLQRLYFYCRRCRRGHAPRDHELDVAGTQYSPGVRRLQALVGSAVPFAQGQTLLAELAGVAVSVKAVERHAEAIGADLAARHEAGRQQAALLQFPPPAGAAVRTLVQRQLEIPGALRRKDCYLNTPVASQFVLPKEAICLRSAPKRGRS